MPVHTEGRRLFGPMTSYISSVLECLIAWYTRRGFKWTTEAPDELLEIVVKPRSDDHLVEDKHDS